MNEIVEEKKKQMEIVETIKKVDNPFRNILFEVYIQGKSLVKVASELSYTYEYTRKINSIALNKFDKISNMSQKVTESYT